MEAVPRLHMLWFALKSSPEGTTFANLKKFIAEFYQEDPESYTKEVFALETLRNQAMHTTKDGSSVMKRYYCQLHSLQNRFPQISERGVFSFTWKDLYQNNVCEVTDMRFELAAVLFNIAASHTQSGASVTRGDVDGMKTACTHFQCAAWAFGELRERYTHVNSGGDFMTAELLVFMQQVCYAQAQECILEKSLIDNRKPNIVSKVTAQIVVYYGAALAALLTGGDDGPVAQVIDANVFKLWKKYVRFKISYLHCILYLYQGQHAEEQRKMGERVTLYQAAWDKLEEARKESKSLPDQREINESLIFTSDVVEAKRKNAKNENEFIYHEAVPELGTIGAVQGANLVNGISFTVSDPEIAGDDIFARLVPMKAHEASSMYSEEKAKLLRKYGKQIEEKDTELISYMSLLTLDNLNISEEKTNKLPQGIVDRCAALNANKSAISDLIAAMSQLAEITAEVESNLSDLAELLQLEEREECEFQIATGVPRTPNPHITELTREYQKYQEAHTRAGESNNTLRNAMSLHVNNLKILARPLPEIQQLVPKLSTELNTAEIFKDVKQIVNKVNEMKAQRAQFHADLRIAVNEDDITAKVIAHGSDEGLQTLFDRELAKHERLAQLIEQNLLAQQNILKALTESYAKAAPILKTLTDVKQKRENFFSSLAASYDVYEDLLAKSAKGLEFYKKLAGNVQKLLTRFKAARDVQSEERQQRRQNIALQQHNSGIAMAHQEVNHAAKSKILTPVPSSTGITTPSTGAPKLRDYLKAKNTSAASIAGAGISVVGNAEVAAINTMGYVPPVRPVPVGSENPTQSACTNYNSVAAINRITSPNEPPPPYSLQQQQYFDPAAAGYTNPMYQQPQENIAPPAYKMQASPNSQFNQLSGQMANLTKQTNLFNEQESLTSPQQQQIQHQAQVYIQPSNSSTNINGTHFVYQQAAAQTDSLPTVATNLAATQSVNTFGYSSQAGQPQVYNPTVNQHLCYPQATPTPPIPTTQPLYVATSVNHDATSNASASLHSGFFINSMQEMPQHQAAIAQQQQQQQQQQVVLAQQQPLQYSLQQQLLLKQQQIQQQHQQQQLQKTFSQHQEQSLQQHLQQMSLYQQPVAPSLAAAISTAPAFVSGASVATQPAVPKAQAYASSATNHPGYSFNPHSGAYEYSSGYQQDAAGNAKHFGQFTFTQQPSLVGTTDSQSAHTMNFATGFDSPIISHTQAKKGTDTTAAGTTKISHSEASLADTENTLTYYTAPYGYHSNNASNTPTYGVHQQQHQMPSEQQELKTTQTAQQQDYNEIHNLKSLYMQSGSNVIANTQTTKSGKAYDSSTHQTSTGAEAAASVPPSNTLASVNSDLEVETKEPSSIDLLSDIDFSSCDLQVPPPIMPEPVQHPQIPSTPSTNLSSQNTQADAEGTTKLSSTETIPAKVFGPQLPECSLAVRKTSLDNLSNCSDLSSLENFDWDSVSATGETADIEKLANNVTSFQMQPCEPFNDDKTLKYFYKEVERYEKIIESLNVKMLNGNTQLSAKWKELLELLAKDTNKRTTTIAKLFPEKNRSLDCVPYDHARVKLDKDTDDYINAAYVKNIGAGCPNFIVGQTPQQNTLNDFWSMVWSQKARTVICLHTTNEMLDPYWPQELEEFVHFDDFTVNCVRVLSLSHCKEYQLKLAMHGTDSIIDLSILQIKQWSKAPCSLPSYVVGVARNAIEAHQQRCLKLNTPNAPLVLNCLTGSERSELVAIAICAVMATQCKRPILLNVVDVWSRICAQRQNSQRDTAMLEQSMQIVLNHAYDVLNKRGIITSYQMKTAPQVASKELQETKDPLNDLDASWKLK